MKILTLSLVLGLALSTPAQTRTDVGIQISGASGLGSVGASYGVAGNVLTRSNKFAFSGDVAVLKATKYTGDGSAIRGRGMIRYYLNSFYLTGGVGIARQSTSQYQATAVSGIGGAGWQRNDTTIQATYDRSNDRHKSQAISFDVEQLIRLKAFYVAVRPFVVIAGYEQNDEAIGRPEVTHNRTDVRAGISVGVGRFWRD